MNTQNSPESRDTSATRMFVLTVSGLGPLVKREIASLEGVKVTATGNDGRADVILCEVRPGRERALLDLRSTEDVFAEIGRTLRAEGDQPPWISKRLWKPQRVGRAMALARKGKGGGAMTFRVAVRVLQERSFKRTDLRRAFERTVSTAERGWKMADPARTELWVLEYSAGKFLAGLRLTTAAMRQHGGRTAERTGALRPAVAAAMVALAGPSRGILVDPCCGSGTILNEAAEGGWAAKGFDIDPDAVRVARRNAKQGTQIEVGDVRELPLEDGSVGACVSNLPFGQQYDVDGDPDVWLRTALAEMARVTKVGGRVVLLVPKLPRDLIPKQLRLADRFPLRLLGTKTAIWSLERR